jgi:hypothetical protein
MVYQEHWFTGRTRNDVNVEESRHIIFACHH